MDFRKWGKRCISCIPSKKLRQKLKDIFWLNHIPFNRYGLQYFHSDEEGNELIYNLLAQGKPCLITRFGMSEFGCVRYFLRNQHKVKIKFPQKTSRIMQHNAGFFSPTNELLTKYSCEFLQILPDIDLLSPMNTTDYVESEVVQKLAPQARLVTLDTLGYYIHFCKNPWTKILKGKKVLIIHPFAATIEKQYSNRERLHKNPQLLPKFDLLTYKPIQGLGSSEETAQFNNWFEALNFMYKQIDKIDFDVALIGAGAYGMFLAHHIKQQGKQAIHMGGNLQLLFGIKGSRWNNTDVAKECYNEHWVSPSKSETPKNLSMFKKGEGDAAYW